MRKILFNDPDSGAFRYEFTEICLNDCYQLESLKKQLPRVDSIVDIGANQGLFLVAARKNFSRASIGAYEPNPHIRGLLSQNAETLAAVSYPEAVTMTNCMVDLHFGESDLHTIAEPSSAGKVPGIAFKKVIERAGGKIDILKMDCEGGEWGLFEDKDTWKHVNSVTMEYHLWAKKGYTARDIRNILEGLDFQILTQDQLSEEFGLITAIRKDTI